jgi:hypothetical protein
MLLQRTVENSRELAQKESCARQNSFAPCFGTKFRTQLVENACHLFAVLVTVGGGIQAQQASV